MVRKNSEVNSLVNLLKDLKNVLNRIWGAFREILEINPFKVLKITDLNI